MIRLPSLCLALAVLALPSAARAQFAECAFGFDIDRQSSIFQSIVIDGEEKRGFWLSINRAPSDVRDVAKYIGRLQVCLTTPDGKPRTFSRGGQNITLTSPFVSNCTAALLPDNRLLTNAHCYYDPDLVRAGFTEVREARINFNYTSRDDTGAVRTYFVDPDELDIDKDLDAMLLKIRFGDANADLGGHIPMTMMAEIEPYQELRMIHHPGADPQQYSTGTCQVHRRQIEISSDRSPFRHTCESMGGSSGSLIYDARTLSVVALHNQGGLNRTGDSFNGGHKIAMVNERFGLGFEPYQGEIVPPDEDALELAAQSALVAALILSDRDQKLAALESVVLNHQGTQAADSAANALSELMAAGAPVNTNRNDAAIKALLAALVLTEEGEKIAALESVVLNHQGTEAADSAAVALTELLAVTPPPPDPAKQREEAAEKALLAAAIQTDDARKIAALEALVRDYDGTQAAKQAVQMLAAILPKGPTLEQQRAAKAQEALDYAITLPELRKLRALEQVGRDYPGTPAAAEAARILDAMAQVTPPPPPEPTLREKMLASPAVQDCDRLAGSPGHPDQATGDMIEPGVPFSAIDGPRAVAACRRALQEFPNHPRLMAFLGDALYVMENYNEGAQWFQRAAELNDPMAQASLGFIYYVGRGVTQNYAVAKQWMERAIAQNYHAGFTSLGLYYFDGRATTRDYRRALELFRQAADMGDPTGYSLLARMYEHGYAVVPDPDRAADLYIKALEGGVDWIIRTKVNWSGATGRALQERLRAMGYYNGAIDGDVGPGTKAAMEALREANL